MRMASARGSFHSAINRSRTPSGSVCTGAFVLAASGLLDGRRATTHWGSADGLAKLFPKVEVDPDPIFVRDGDVWTSAGVTASLASRRGRLTSWTPRRG